LKIPLFKIYWDEDDVRAVNEVIRSGMYWTTGPKSKEFEKMIAEYLGRKYAVVFNSGTSALHAAVLAHRIKGGEVIVPSFTFIATSNALLMAGVKPVFADIEEKTFGLDPKSVEAVITKKTKAIIPVHYGGSPCMIRELRDVAEDHKVLLIEDAAESFGAKIGKEKVGNFGDSAMISFCQNKVITTGEGGAVVTDSQDVYERLRLVRSHGRLENMDYFSTWKEMDYVTLGYNYRMSDITAALGISQLSKLDKLVQMRRRKASRLTAGIRRVKGVVPPRPPEGYHHIYQMYTVRVKKGKEARDKLANYLGENGISGKVYFYPVHSTHFYKNVLKYRCRLPVTDDVSQQVLSLPIYPSMTTKEIDYIVDEIKSFEKVGKK
jgi:dTDP-4-amino-4,6-dideoxygalactose transaminase